MSDDPDWKETADFIELVNNWFDVCNASRKYGRHPGVHGYGVDLERQNGVLDRMTTMMSTMRVMSKSSKKQALVPFQKGIIMNNMALKELLPYLQSKYNTDQSLQIEYVLTRKLNQDIMEQVLSTFRAMGRTDDNPSALGMKYRVRNYILGKHATTVLAANTKEYEENAEEDVVLTHDFQSTSGLEKVSEEATENSTIPASQFSEENVTETIHEWNMSDIIADGDKLAEFCVFSNVVDTDESNFNAPM